MKKLLNCILVTFLIIVQDSEQVKAQPAFITDSLDSYVSRAIAQWQIPGLAVAVVKDGKVIVAKGYGVRDVKTNEKVDEFTLFQIASNTKAFTGTAISLLNYQKRLFIDTTVTTYLKDFKLYDAYATQQATLRDLLCHRLGYATFQGDFLHWGSNLTRSELVFNFRNLKPEYKFRYKYGYTNMGFVAAGEIVKVVTDTTWDDYITAHFFKPLQMQHTNVSYNDLINDKNACKPYTLVDNKLVELPYTYIDNIGACANINSCVSDMANWLLMQLDSGRFNGTTVVPWPALAETRNSQMIIGDVSSRMFPTKHFTTYGLGWQLYDYNGKKVCEHGGGANGFVTKTKFIPEMGLGVIVYTNTDANNLYEALTTQIIDAYMQLPYRNYSDIYLNRYKAATLKDSAEIADFRAVVAKKNKPDLKLKDYTGKYTNSFYGEIEIKEEKGQLNIYFSHHPNNVGLLQYMEGNKFLCTYTDVVCGVKVTTFSVEKNKVKAVTITVADFIDPFPYEFIKK